MKHVTLLTILLTVALAACSGYAPEGDEPNQSDLGRSEQAISFPDSMGYSALGWSHLPCDYEDTNDYCQVSADPERMYLWTTGTGAFRTAVFSGFSEIAADLGVNVVASTSEPAYPWFRGIRVKVRNVGTGQNMGVAWEPSRAVHVACVESFSWPNTPGAEVASCKDYVIAIDDSEIARWRSVNAPWIPMSTLRRAAVLWGGGHAAGLPTKPGTGTNAMSQYTLASFIADVDFNTCQYDDVQSHYYGGASLQVYPRGTCVPGL